MRSTSFSSDPSASLRRVPEPHIPANAHNCPRPNAPADFRSMYGPIVHTTGPVGRIVSASTPTGGARIDTEGMPGPAFNNLNAFWSAISPLHGRENPRAVAEKAMQAVKRAGLGTEDGKDSPATQTASYNRLVTYVRTLEVEKQRAYVWLAALAAAGLDLPTADPAAPIDHRSVLIPSSLPRTAVERIVRFVHDTEFPLNVGYRCDGANEGFFFESKAVSVRGSSPSARGRLTERELQNRLKEGSVLLFSTSQGMKVSECEAELARYNFSPPMMFVHAGSYDASGGHTAERHHNAEANGLEKAVKASERLPKADAFGGAYKNVLGVTDDAEWHVVFDEAVPSRQQASFLRSAIEQCEQAMGHRYHWALEQVADTGFPGPNLAVFEKCLPRGVEQLLEILQEAAREAGIEGPLRYQENVCYSFADKEGNTFSKTFTQRGTLRGPDVFRTVAGRVDRPPTEGYSFDLAMVPDEQTMSKTELKESGDAAALSELPRRQAMAYIAALAGAKLASLEEAPTPRCPRMRLLHPSTETTEEPESRFDAQAFESTPYPALRQKRRVGSKIPLMGTYDAVVLANAPSASEEEVTRLLIDTMVSEVVEPGAKGTPIIVDNRKGTYNAALQKLRADQEALRAPMYSTLIVVQDDEDWKAAQTAVGLRTRLRHNLRPVESDSTPFTIPPKVGQTLDRAIFIAAGHGDNTLHDKEVAYALGRALAEMDIPVCTGGGTLEGPMGAFHTGWLSFYLEGLTLDEADTLGLIEREIQRLNQFRRRADNRIDVHALIEYAPDLVDKLADAGLIPARNFVACSTDEIILLESPIGRPPPGTTYIGAQNIDARRAVLTRPKTAIVLNGKLGTTQEALDLIELMTQERAIIDAQPGGNHRLHGMPGVTHASSFTELMEAIRNRCEP